MINNLKTILFALISLLIISLFEFFFATFHLQILLGQKLVMTFNDLAPGILHIGKFFLYLNITAITIFEIFNIIFKKQNFYKKAFLGFMSPFLVLISDLLVIKSLGIFEGLCFFSSTFFVFFARILLESVPQSKTPISSEC